MPRVRQHRVDGRRLVQPARVEFTLLDPKLCCERGIVAAHLLDEPLGVLAADEGLDRVTEREVRREGVVNDGVNDHAPGFASSGLSTYCDRSQSPTIRTIAATMMSGNLTV